MNSNLADKIKIQWGKLGANDFISMALDLGYDEAKDYTNMNIPVVVPPQIICYKWETYEALCSTLQLHLPAMESFVHRFGLEEWDDDSRTAHHILRWSSPKDFNGEVDTHITKTIEVPVSGEWNYIFSSIQYIARQILDIFNTCSKSQSVWISPFIQYLEYLTITNHPSLSYKECLFVDSHHDHIMKRSHNVIDLQFTRTGQKAWLDKYIEPIVGLHQQVCNAWDLSAYALQYELGQKYSRYLGKNVLFLFQTRLFSKVHTSNHSFSQSDFSYYQGRGYLYIENRFDRHFGSTPKEWVYARCYQCETHLQVNDIEPQEPYMIYIKRSWFGSTAENETMDNLKLWLRNIPYPKGTLIGYISRGRSMEHNQTRYVMEALKNDGVAFLTDNIIELQTLFGSEKYIDLHWVSDGRTMFLKKI